MTKVPSRRTLLAALAGIFAVLSGKAARAASPGKQVFIDKAYDMKRLAERAGDQGYGAVVVRGTEIVGLGPSRVVVKKDPTAHAELEALRDAQAKLGKSDLSGCVMYSTSRPCGNCERAAAQAKISRMYYGLQGTDAGVPRDS
jgi:tRNA(Arg) A34 adenosine deaminase TadA